VTDVLSVLLTVTHALAPNVPIKAVDATVVANQKHAANEFALHARTVQLDVIPVSAQNAAKPDVIVAAVQSLLHVTKFVADVPIVRLVATLAIVPNVPKMAVTVLAVMPLVVPIPPVSPDAMAAKTARPTAIPVSVQSVKTVVLAHAVPINHV